MIGISEINAIAGDILAKDIDPIPRFRLLRDVLKGSPRSSSFERARDAALQSRWVRMLIDEQYEDGSWGRFHTENTKKKQRIHTTQYAISRGLELGLQKDDPPFAKAASYMEDILLDRKRWRDGYEKNPWFSPGVKLFTAASLASIDPKNPSLSTVLEPWFEVFCRAFQSGEYDIQAEREASIEILGVDIAGSYISFSSAPNLVLFGAVSDLVPEKMQKALLNAVWNGGARTFYIRSHPGILPESTSSRAFFGWLQTVQVLSRFPACGEFAAPAIEWLWSQRTSEGLWDCFPRPDRIPQFPLSENWRRKGNRRIDCSTQILVLIRKWLGRE